MLFLFDPPPLKSSPLQSLVYFKHLFFIPLIHIYIPFYVHTFTFLVLLACFLPFQSCTNV